MTEGASIALEKNEGAAPRCAVMGAAGWRVEFHGAVASTNDLAAERPPWSAIVADCQTQGRGRFGRSFLSDDGGLWLSAVVPAPGGARKWNGFSLAVGLELVRMLQALGVPSARLRWPNDLLSGNRKLAGLLLEQGSRETLTVGLGLNIRNKPWEADPSLATGTTRLADCLSPCPSFDDCLERSLDAIADAHEFLDHAGLAGVVRALDGVWQRGWVRLSLHGGGAVEGRFLGLDPEGNLRLEDHTGALTSIPHATILRLSELSTSNHPANP